MVLPIIRRIILSIDSDLQLDFKFNIFHEREIVGRSKWIELALAQEWLLPTDGGGWCSNWRIYNWIHLPTNSHPYRCLSLSRLRSTTNNCVTSERTSSVCSRRTLTDWDSCHHLSTTTVLCSKRLSFLFFHPSFKPSPWRMPLLLQETSEAGVHSRRPTQRQRWTKNRLPELEIYCCGCVAISLKARTGTIK